MINDQSITLDDTFNGRQFNGLERNDTSKSLLLDEQNKNGTCQNYSCLIYYYHYVSYFEFDHYFVNSKR